MLLEALRRHAGERPNHPALLWSGGECGFAELLAEVEDLAAGLRRRGVRILALALPNGAPWVVADLAAIAAGVTLIPLPPFFSPTQIGHCLEQAGAEALLTTPATLQGAFAALAAGAEIIQMAGEELSWLPLPSARPGVIPEGVSKVTYTSGTTGSPKGVMLTLPQQERVAAALAEAAGIEAEGRHLCISPLAILLENIGGIYAPLLAGITTVLPTMEEVGLQGAAGLDPRRLAATLEGYRASSAILSPAMLQGLVAVGMRPGGLRFLAVGGAAVAPRLLEAAGRLGLPVFQGYGLSECSSVVTLNRPGADRPGSVGRPLPHWELRIADDGEVLVRGDLFRGYLGEPAPVLTDGWWRTGDLGRIDADGYLFLDGRRKNLIITAFSRNLSPEWVENELQLHPAIAQVALFGDARPWNLALITPVPGTDREQIEAAIAETNGRLPDYARVRRWIVTDQPFSLLNGQLTGTGRLRRETIQAVYQQRIEQSYRQERYA